MAPERYVDDVKGLRVGSGIRISAYPGFRETFEKLAKNWLVHKGKGKGRTRKSCTGQVLRSAKYRPTRIVVDAA